MLTYGSSFALELSEYPQVDMLGVRYKYVNFGTNKNAGSVDRWPLRETVTTVVSRYGTHLQRRTEASRMKLPATCAD